MGEFYLFDLLFMKLIILCLLYVGVSLFQIIMWQGAGVLPSPKFLLKSPEYRTLIFHSFFPSIVFFLITVDSSRRVSVTSQGVTCTPGTHLNMKERHR